MLPVDDVETPVAHAKQFAFEVLSEYLPTAQTAQLLLGAVPETARP